MMMKDQIKKLQQHKSQILMNNKLILIVEDEEDILELIEDAKAVEAAGAFSIVIEGVVEEAAKRISEAVSIPTIGIGAGKYTDGQVLVWSDMLGFFQAFQPKFVKRYLEGGTLVQKALDSYIKEVQERSFPSAEHTYTK